MRMAEAQQELESRPVPSRISKMIKDNWKSTAEQMLADEKAKETAAAAAAARGSTDTESSTVYTRSAMYAWATSINLFLTTAGFVQATVFATASK
jgi:hypothetical protein